MKKGDCMNRKVVRDGIMALLFSALYGALVYADFSFNLSPDYSFSIASFFGATISLAFITVLFWGLAVAITILLCFFADDKKDNFVFAMVRKVSICIWVFWALVILVQFTRGVIWIIFGC